MSKNIFLRESLILLVVALLFGVSRQWMPDGISWNGKWPTSSTSAYEAYQMMAEESDPPFASLQDVIELQRAKTATILDARASKDFIEGRIPGARSLPYYEIDEFMGSAMEGLKADSPIVIYCEGIGCELSFFLGRELQQGGFRNVKIFYGGFPEWKEAGLPIEK